MSWDILGLTKLDMKYLEKPPRNKWDMIYSIVLRHLEVLKYVLGCPRTT